MEGRVDSPCLDQIEKHCAGFYRSTVTFTGLRKVGLRLVLPLHVAMFEFAA